MAAAEDALATTRPEGVWQTTGRHYLGKYNETELKCATCEVVLLEGKELLQYSNKGEYLKAHYVAAHGPRGPYSKRKVSATEQNDAEPAFKDEDQPAPATATKNKKKKKKQRVTFGQDEAAVVSQLLVELASTPLPATASDDGEKGHAPPAEAASVLGTAQAPIAVVDDAPDASSSSSSSTKTPSFTHLPRDPRLGATCTTCKPHEVCLHLTNGSFLGGAQHAHIARVHKGGDDPFTFLASDLKLLHVLGGRLSVQLEVLHAAYGRSRRGPPDSNYISLCRVCRRQTIAFCFTPCGHLGICGSCLPTNNVCSICRLPANLQHVKF